MGQNATQTRLKRLVVVLDPSSSEGDTTAQVASALVGEEGELQLVVPLSGPEALSLHDYAESEGVSIKEAAGIYLAQVSERLGRHGLTSTLIDGTDLAADLIEAVEQADAQGVVAPAELAARTMATKRRWAALPFPVVVVPARAA